MNLPLLIMQSAENGLIEVNSRPVGEVGGNAASVCVPISGTGVYYITFIPLWDSPNVRTFPVTKKLVFTGGVLQTPKADEYMEIIAWPGCMYQVILCAAALPLPSTGDFPFTVAHIDWPLHQRYIATLFWDNALCVSIEDPSGRMVFGHTLLTNSRKGALRLLQTDAALLIASGPCEHGEYLLCLGMQDGVCSVLLEMEAAAFQWDKSEARFTCIERIQTARLHEQFSQYAFSDGEWMLVSRDAPSPTRPIQTPQDLAQAFAEALEHNLEQETMGYLGRSLSDGLDFDTLKSFVGPFSNLVLPDFAVSPIDGEVVLGLYTKQRPLSEGRLFALAIEKEIGWHISNIREW